MDGSGGFRMWQASAPQTETEDAAVALWRSSLHFQVPLLLGLGMQECQVMFCEHTAAFLKRFILRCCNCCNYRYPTSAVLGNQSMAHKAVPCNQARVLG